MATLENSNRRLLEGLTLLMRENISGWSNNSEYNVDNVWPNSVPTSAEDEFPRGVVDITSGEDFELSINLDVKLREVVVKVVVFAETSAEAEDLIDKTEDNISSEWDSNASSPKSSWTSDEYTGDWTFREIDGFTPLVEDGDVEGELRYNRSQDFVFETVKQN